MGLSEGVRRIYGLPSGDQSQLGSWYQHYYRPFGSRTADQMQREIQAQVERTTGLPDPGGFDTPSIAGAQSLGAPGRLQRKGTTTRGAQALDRSNPAFMAALQAQQLRQEQSGYDPLTGLPNYYQNASAPGSYQQQQAARQEQGLYTKAHVGNPGSWSPDQISKLQRKLVKAGLLTNRFHLGVYDNETRTAYDSLLSMANNNGAKTESQMLEQLQATQPEDLASLYRAPAFAKPDRAALIDDIELAFEQRLGRAPTSGERKELAEYYTRQFKREYRLETLPQDKGAFLQAGATPAEEQLGMTPELPSVQEVDPGKRFAQYFRKRYRNEEDELKRREERKGQQVTATQGFEQLRAMMAGGGVQQLSG